MATSDSISPRSADERDSLAAGTSTDEDLVNILVTLDENCLPALRVMLFSLLRANPGALFDVYLLHAHIPHASFAPVERVLRGRGRLLPVRVDDALLRGAPTTRRYPREIYYRIFAADLLPKSLDRVLYLDPDVIVGGSILPLYRLELPDYYFAAASHTGRLLTKFNVLRLGMEDESPYINSGVLLMNLALLRREQDTRDVIRFIERYRRRLFLPDQDVISALYGSKIYALDAFRYNMTERLFALHAPFERDLTIDWVRRNAVIVHYCGRNKPWRPGYRGSLGIFYQEAAEALSREEGK